MCVTVMLTVYYFISNETGNVCDGNVERLFISNDRNCNWMYENKKFTIIVTH